MGAEVETDGGGGGKEYKEGGEGRLAKDERSVPPGKPD
jgi:hypothetical protein